MSSIKLTSIGNSVGAVFPKEILALLGVDKGDVLYFTRTPYGIELSPYNAKIARQLEIGERIMREDRDVLKKLAE